MSKTMPGLLLLLAPLLLGACSTAPSALQQGLQHHHWVLERLDGRPVAASRVNPPSLEIGEHFTVNGVAGCNRYVGQGRLDGDRFRIGELTLGTATCQAPLDAIERAVITTLIQGATLSQGPQSLILSGQRHRLEYRLRDWVF